MNNQATEDTGLLAPETVSPQDIALAQLLPAKPILNLPSLTESLLDVNGRLLNGEPGATLGSSLPPVLSDANGWAQPQYYTTIQCADIDGDGQLELLARSSTGIQAWKYADIDEQWNGLPAGPGLSDASGWDQAPYYSTIQFADIDGDGRAEMVARSANGMIASKYDAGAQAWSELPAGPSFSDANGWKQPQYYSTIQCADVDGDGQLELLGRSAGGMYVFKYDTATQTWNGLPMGPGFSDAGGWAQPQYYSTIQCADIDGDGQAEIVARSATGMEIYKCDKIAHTWSRMPNGPAFSDASDWDKVQYYSTIRCADVDGDGQAEIVARSAAGMVISKYNAATQTWNELPAGPSFSDANGWAHPQYYSTIQCADVDGDGQLELLGRSAGGMVIYKYDAAAQAWNELADGPALSDPNGWAQPQYYSTIQCADINGDGLAEMLARGVAGMFAFADDKVRNAGWESFPGLGPIPLPTPENLASVTQSLTNMDTFVNQYHDFFQDVITTLYQLSQVSDSDPGQAFANAIIATAFKAIAAVPVPGAGVISGVLGGVFTYVSTNDPRGDLHKVFADVWGRFSQNLLDTKTQIATYNSALLENWTNPLVNQATGQTMLLADLSTHPFPAQATKPFDTLLNQCLRGGKVALYREVIPQRWNKVSVMNPSDLTFATEQKCRDWIESYINKNTNYYITYYQGDATWPAKGKVWRVNEWWLGYGFFPYGHHEAPAALCNEIFTDDGLGNIVRPTALATRAEVFNNWSLPVQRVAMPSYGGGMSTEARTALATAQIHNTPVELAGQDLAGAVLVHAALAQANLAGIRAAGAQLAKSDLRAANLEKAELPEANLNYARLPQARLQGANLSQAQLQFADARGADLRHATLSGALALGLHAPAANLAGAVLKGAVLRGANLREADLTNADLSGADLMAADLRGAKLDGANLAHALLRGADLTGASLPAQLESAENAFAVGLPGEAPAPKPTRAVRCVAEGAATGFDAVTFLKVSNAFADLLDETLPASYGQLVENFEAALGTFALFSVPLTTPNPSAPASALALSFGTGGPAFYTQVAQQMQGEGVPAQRADLLGQLGSTASYCPFGFRNSLITPGVDVHAEFQGPTGLAEVNTLLNQAGADGMATLVQSAATALGTASAMLTAIDFSPSQAARTQVYFAVTAGDAVAFGRLMAALGLTWPVAATVDQWLARTTVPYLVSVGLTAGNSTPEIGVYLPNDPDRNSELDSLLDAPGRSRFDGVEALTTQYPLTLAYVGLVWAPDGTLSVSAQVAFD